jgi:hypothetical protein
MVRVAKTISSSRRAGRPDESFRREPWPARRCSAEPLQDLADASHREHLGHDSESSRCFLGPPWRRALPSGSQPGASSCREADEARGSRSAVPDTRTPGRPLPQPVSPSTHPVRQPTPGEHLVGRDPVPPRHETYAHAWLSGLRDNRQLVARRPPTPPLWSRKDLTLRYRTSYRHGMTPTPYESGRTYPVNLGAASPNPLQPSVCVMPRNRSRLRMSASLDAPVFAYRLFIWTRIVSRDNEASWAI